MKIIITNRIYLYHCTNPNIRKKLIDHLTIVNPKHTEAVQAGRRCFHIPKTVSMFSQHTNDCFSIPRGAENYLNKLLDKYDPNAEFDDRTHLDEPGIDYECKIEPREDQIEPIKAGLDNNSGVISKATGTGKTVIALYLIAKRKQKTMILVHSKLLFYQWRDRIKEFLNYDCGLVGDSKFIVKDITVGLVRTVINKSKSDNFAKKFGLLVIDECHKVSSSTFTEAAALFEPYYLQGLTATADRRDGLGKFIFFALGDLIYHSSKSTAVEQGKILKPTINKINTNLRFGDPEKHCDYTELLSKLKNSEQRNQMICEKIIKISQQNFACALVISDHTTHLKHFQNIFDFMGIKYHLLTGKLTTKQTKKVTDDLKNNKVEILLATAGLIQEGYDYDGFTDMFTTMPISHYVRHEQLIGRLVRTKKGKKNVTIHDFVDLDHVFQKQWGKRKKVYESY